VIPKGGIDECVAPVSTVPRQSRRERTDVWTVSARSPIGIRSASDRCGRRLTQWYRPGLLCIGDAAHAMSPIGGVGVNLAVVGRGVAAANLLWSRSAPGAERGRLARVQRGVCFRRA